MENNKQYVEGDSSPTPDETLLFPGGRTNALQSQIKFNGVKAVTYIRDPLAKEDEIMENSEFTALGPNPRMLTVADAGDSGSVFLTQKEPGSRKWEVVGLIFASGK